MAMFRTGCVGCLAVVGTAAALLCIGRLLVFLSALVEQEQELESGLENWGKLWSTPPDDE